MKTATRLLLSSLLAMVSAAAMGHYSPPDSNLPAERGKTAVGVTFLFNVDYVHAGQRGVTGVAYVVTAPGACGQYPGYDKPTDFIANAVLHYRWRHLEIFPSDRYQYGQWHTLLMFPRSEPDLLYTLGEIPVPEVACDLEWYLTYTMRIPYYQYVDYTGRNIPVSKAGYTEAPAVVGTNRMDYAGEVPLPSGGREWFIRVRPHRSSIHSMRLSL